MLSCLIWTHFLADCRSLHSSPCRIPDPSALAETAITELYPMAQNKNEELGKRASESILGPNPVIGAPTACPWR